jgi:hypothetical protein
MGIALLTDFLDFTTDALSRFLMCGKTGLAHTNKDVPYVLCSPKDPFAGARLWFERLTPLRSMCYQWPRLKSG